MLAYLIALIYCLKFVKSLVKQAQDNFPITAGKMI
jgi:hypothetical protein